MIDRQFSKRRGRTIHRSAATVALALGLFYGGQACAQQAGPQADPAASAPAPADATPQTDTADASRKAPGDIVVTGRFVDTGASSATKLDVRVLDTPFSVAAYNGNFLKAIETTSVSDLYKYMNGIQRAGNTSYDISFRGFKTSANDRNAILTDGLPGLTVRDGSPPTIGVDHVELVKGPASVLYGQAQPGGFINIISKKPKDTPEFEIDLKGLSGLGSDDRELGGLFSLDATGPITSDGSLSARFVGEGGYTRGFRDFSYEKPIYAAPSLTWKLGDRTTITAQGEYREVRTHYDTFLVAPNLDATKVARITTTYQEPDDYLHEEGAAGSLFVTHRFSDSIKFNLGYRYVDHTDDQSNFDVIGFRDPAQTIVTRRARGQLNKRTYSFVDTNLAIKANTFGIHHTAVLGFNGGQETASLERTQWYNCTGSQCNSLDVSLYDPQHGNVPSPLSFPLYNPGQAKNLTWRDTTQNSLGFYGSDLIEFSRMFKAMVGLRYADERQTIVDERNPSAPPVRKKDHKVLPLAGLLFEPTHHLTFYTSYSTSFVAVPAGTQDNFGNNPFTPTSASSIEGGVKADLFDRRLSVTADYFDIEKKNTINSFTCLTEAELIAQGITIPPGATIATGTCSNQLGKERSRGFELEVNATPLPNWQITAGYSHTHARIVNSNIAAQVGARETNAPDNSFNFWSRYDFVNGPLNNLGLGLGVSFIGERSGLLPTVVNDPRPDGGTLPLASYTTVDAGLYYKLNDAIDLTLKVSNLFDKRFIESTGFSGAIQLFPGEPRLMTFTVRTHF